MCVAHLFAGDRCLWDLSPAEGALRSVMLFSVTSVVPIAVPESSIYSMRRFSVLDRVGACSNVERRACSNR